MRIESEAVWDPTLQQAYRDFRERAERQPKGRTLAAMAFAIASVEFLGWGTGRRISAVDFARYSMHDHFVATALAASTAAQGGLLIQEAIADDFLELLRPFSAVRALGARVVPMPRGNLSMKGLWGGATAHWTGEQQGVRASAPTMRELKLTAKKVVCNVPISNDLIRGAGVAAVDYFKAEMLAAVAGAENLAFICGPGTQYTPKGLRQWAGNRNSAQSSPDGVKVTTDTGKALLNLTKNNVRMISPGWIMNPATGIYLSNQRDASGARAWPELDRGFFRGLPVAQTMDVPTNLGAGEDESEVYVADFFDVFIGQVPGIEVRASSQADYYDSDGNLQSTTVRDETLLQVIEEVDLGVRHPESVNIIEAVTWLAS